MRTVESPLGPLADDVLAALARHSERVAFQDAREEVTYRQARDQVYRMARALLGRGLRGGRVVAYVTRISPQALLLGYAINLVGCGQMEVSIELPVEARADLIIEAGAAAVVIDPAVCGDDLARLLTGPHPPQIFSLGPGGFGEDLLALAGRESPLPFPSGAPPDGRSMFNLTGGTTGRPKIVVRRFGSLTPHQQELPGLSHTEPPVRVLEWGRLTPLEWRLAEAALTSGGSVSTETHFDATAVVATIETHRVTHLRVAPHQLRAVVDHPLLTSADISSLRWVLCTSARASACLLRRAVERLGPVVYQGYGLTEAAGVSRLVPEDYFPDRWERLATCGRAMSGVEITVRDAAGHAACAGERGDLWVRTPYAMAGYLHHPDLTAQVLRDGWLRTGDVGSLDEEGFLTVLGRATDAVEHGDRRVFYSEIENYVEEQPGVQDCAVFTVPEPGHPPVAHLAVVTNAVTGGDEGGFRNAVLQEFGPASVPRSVFFVSRIPITHGNIPDRPLLAQWWSTGQTR